MDKADRALMIAEDTAERVNALRHGVTCAEFTGVDAAIAGQPRSVYADITVVDPTAVIARFDGGAGELMIGDKTLASGTSPLFAVIENASGKLCVSGLRENSKALVIGNVKIIK